MGELLQLLLFQALTSTQGKSGVQEDLGFLHLVLLDCSNIPKSKAPPWKPLRAEQCQGGERKKQISLFIEVLKLGGGSLILGTWHCPSE